MSSLVYDKYISQKMTLEKITACVLVLNRLFIAGFVFEGALWSALQDSV